MPRSMEGHGLSRTRYPPPPRGTELPALSTTSAAIPGSGMVAEPGLVVVRLGIGLIIAEPVSVCHQVSTIGQRSAPIFLWYHIHASGLIGSPTVPRTRNV